MEVESRSETLKRFYQINWHRCLKCLSRNCKINRSVISQIKTVFWCISLCHHAGFSVQASDVTIARLMNF